MAALQRAWMMSISHLEEERLRVVDENLLDGVSAPHPLISNSGSSTKRLALRQLHEEPLKLLNQHTIHRLETSLSIVREALDGDSCPEREREPATAAAVEPPVEHDAAAIPGRDRLLCSWKPLPRWRSWLSLPGRAQRDGGSNGSRMRSARVQLRRLVDTQLRGMSRQTLQRLSAEALTTAARADAARECARGPDVRTYPLRGHANGGSRRGPGFFSPSRGVALTASGLPPTACGSGVPSLGHHDTRSGQSRFCPT